jgi:hypothetical protein
MSFFSICEFQVRNGAEAEFLRVARALAQATTIEPGTLRYQWHVTPTPGRYSIVEEYVDADAAQTHNNHVGPLLGQLFALGELVSANLFGELNDYISAWATGRPGVTVHKVL